jgi:hypothetical protein
MRPIQYLSPSFTAADADGIAVAQTLAVAGNLTLTASTVTLAPPRFVTITSVGDETGVNFTITGTSPNGSPQTETIAGANAGAATSTLAFASVTSIAADDATADDVSAGFTQSGYTAWWPLDIYTPNQVTTTSVNISGTLNYTVEFTNEDPFNNSIEQLSKVHPSSDLVTASTDQTHSTTVLMRAVRFKVNSGSGTARVTVTQQSTA